MPLKIDSTLTSATLVPAIERALELSGAKILALEKSWDATRGTPVFTVEGKYTSRGWTEWTQGFQFGSALLQFDATGDKEFLELGRARTLERMPPHLTATGVHDHGFNNVSTYGALWRLAGDGKYAPTQSELQVHELALKVSGAVQANRWTELPGNTGFIYSFNGPHSLFVDTLRSLRVLALAHQLGHVLMGEGDRPISLLERLLSHAVTTAQFNIYYGERRDAYDLCGRTAHESIFNLNDGSYRCPSSQQGYSPFSTWTRGLAWAILGFSEQLEFLRGLKSDRGGDVVAGKLEKTVEVAKKAALATADFYLENCCADGIPMWDTGAPNLRRLGDYLSKSSDPFNAWEPVDSSAAAIAAQGLFRLGNVCHAGGAADRGQKYRLAALTVARTLFAEPYLSTTPEHQGLLLHSVYHRPNGWDHIRAGQKVPNAESSMWGDYHLRELAVLLLREARGEPYLKFFC